MTPVETSVLAMRKSGLYGGPAGPLPGQQEAQGTEQIAVQGDEQNTKQNAPPGEKQNAAQNSQPNAEPNATQSALPAAAQQAEQNTEQNTEKIAPQTAKPGAGPNTTPGLALDSAFNWQQLLKIGQQHQITPLLYYGLVHAKIKMPPAVETALYKVTVSAVLITQNQQHALKAVCRAFEQNGICYLPLKGAVLQQLYAKPEQRLMSDADLLIKPEQYEKIKTILIDLGFLEGQESNHELIWHKPGALHLELHKMLIPSYNRDYFAYYGNGWKLAKPTKTSRFCFSPEDEFIYLFTHFAKHYRDGGIGLKHAVDLYVFINANPALNQSYILAELKKLQLLSFYQNILAMLRCWFSGEGENKVTGFLTQKIFQSGAYGTPKGHVIAQGTKTAKSVSAKNVRAKKLLQMVFLPYSGMAQRYPVLKKAPVLLPLFWVVRWADTLVFHRSHIRRQQKVLQTLKQKEIENYQQQLNFVGLDFNFKE